MQNSRQLAAILGLILLLGCQQEVASNQQKPDQPAQSERADEIVEKKPVSPNLAHKGTVQFIGLEGGFFGIITEKGERLLPMNLEKKYQQDGAIIEFSGEYKKGMMTIQQWGTPFTIKEIKLIQPGKPTTKPNY